VKGAKEGAPFKVYEGTEHVGIHLKERVAGVELIGREVKDADHYPLVKARSRYVLWGFQAGPAKMTAGGKELFIAICRHAAKLGGPKGGEKPPTASATSAATTRR
jgi:hypothetical protein